MAKFFGNVWDAVPPNTAINGRIVIYNGGNRISILIILHYNDIGKDSKADFGRCAMLKLNILNINNFLRLILEVSSPGDYMGIVSYYAGDC